MTVCQAIRTFALTFILAACGDSGSGTGAQSGPSDGGLAGGPQACELVMGWDPWEPYQYEIAGGHVFGLDVDILTAVARSSGCELAFQRGSWRELLHLLQQGQIDLVAGATVTPEREQFARFTAPYRKEEFYLYVAAEQLPDIRNKSLMTMLEEGFRIGVTEGYLYGEPMATFQDDPAYADQFVYSSMAETNFGRLLDGDVNGVIEDRFVGASILRHKSLHELIVPHNVRFESRPVSIMISRASVDEDLFQAMDRSVRELKANGAIGMILAQYQNP